MCAVLSSILAKKLFKIFSLGFSVFVLLFLLDFSVKLRSKLFVFQSVGGLCCSSAFTASKTSRRESIVRSNLDQNKISSFFWEVCLCGGRGLVFETGKSSFTPNYNLICWFINV